MSQRTVRPILGDYQGVAGFNSDTQLGISKHLTGKGRHHGSEDGWVSFGISKDCVDGTLQGWCC
eukprot:2460520-Amphidinium_carterae.3